MGDFDFSRTSAAEDLLVCELEEGSEMAEFGRKSTEAAELAKEEVEAESSGELSPAKIEAYKPKIVNREWLISETDLDWITIGCYILGTGGGGSPYSHMLRLREVCNLSHSARSIFFFREIT